MSCMSMRRPGQSIAQRQAAVKAALKKLEAKLQAGRVGVVISPQGAIAFQGWTVEDREDLTDACTYTTLQAEGSWAFKCALARAEALSGRKVNVSLVMSGHHSHDGGKTYGPGH